MSKLFYVASSSEDGIRLDIFLARQIDHESRATIQKWIERGSILLNGQATKPGHKMHPGDRVEVDVPEKVSQHESLQPWICPLEILYEDRALLAINKPAGVVTHPGAGNRKETIANALILLYPEIKNVGHPVRPGIVHRLDKETSGVLLVAKTEVSYLALSRMFKERKIEKHYRAFAYGTFRLREGTIDKALGRDPKDRKKISVRAKRSRNAVTLYRVLKQFEFATLLDILLVTGRTHQIRVHLSSEGHPIVGDLRYGGGNWNRITNPQLRAELKQADFFGLHAFSLDFSHPLSGVPMHLEASLPSIWHEISAT